MAIVTNADTCLRWLENDRPDLDEARQAAERIARNGHRAADILRSIRGLARKSGPEITRFDINAMIAEASPSPAANCTDTMCCSRPSYFPHWAPSRPTAL